MRYGFTMVEWVIVCIIFLILGALAIPAVLDNMAFDAKVACEARRMIARRYPLSTRVMCVPALTRQDTTTLNVNHHEADDAH